MTGRANTFAPPMTGESEEELRARGLRPITIWVPDVNSPEFAAEAHRQSKAVAESPNEAEDQAFVDAISDKDW